MAIGTFGSFTQARLAIYAAQTGLSITGNNISNINTVGYTRQRLDQSSLHVGGTDRYANANDVRTGQGVLCTGVSQLRDPYLDIRYRSASADFGYLDSKLGGMQQIASILDEVAKGEQTEGKGFGILGAYIDEIRKALGNLTEQTGHAEYDRQVKAAAEKVAGRFNEYANKLQQLYDNTVQGFEKDVTKVNGLLTSIRELNEEIRKCDIYGDKALELRDQRNVLIDELSSYVKIDVTYSMEEISPGQEVEKITIKLDDANPDPSVLSDTATLIDGIYAAQLSIDQVPQWRELDPKDTTTWPYVDAAGNPVMTKAEAAEAKVANPAYATDNTQPKYLKADGTPTDDIAEAAPARTLNPEADLTQPNAAGNEWYLDADGAVTTDPNLSQATYEANPDYKPYLDGKGQPTADADEAKLVNNPNFNLTLSELRDRKGYLHYVIEKQTPVELKLGDPGYQDAIDNLGKVVQTKDPDTGDLHVVSYVKSGEDGNGDPIYTKNEYIRVMSKAVSLDDNDLYGALQSERELLTEAGEFTDTSIIDGSNENSLSCDENAIKKRGIPYYQRSLDLLAQQLANALNQANQGYRYDTNGNYITQVLDADGNPLVDENTGKLVGAPISITYEVKDAAGNTVLDDNGDPVTAEYFLSKNTEWDKQEVWDSLPDEVKTALGATGETGSKAVEAYLKQPQTHQVQDTDADGKPLFDGNGDPVMVDVPYTDENGKPITLGVFDGGNLFSNHGNSDDDTNITASNISVSHSWSKNAISIVNSFQCAIGDEENPPDAEPASGDSSNILHLQNLFTTKMDYIPNSLLSTMDSSGESMFNGSFSEMWENIGSILGNDQTVTNDSLNTSYQTALSIDTSRDSVSSVDFNDEAMNLMMYAKSYNAACRLMTTIDTVLDKLINNTGVTT